MPSFFHLLVALLGFSILPTTTRASSANYNPIHYDRMRHFTPDGRLLQVEYAMRAAEHSSPLAVCRLDEDTLVLVALQKKAAQDRLVVIDDGVVVALSGILADSLALLRVANREWLEWKTLRGEENVNPRICRHVLTKAISEQCHANSFQQGIRPFGACLLLLASSDGDKIWQTDPSGAVAEISSSSLSEGEGGGIQLIRIVGGSPEDAQKIDAAIQKWNDGAARNDATLKEKIRSLTHILMQAREEVPTSGSLFKRKKKEEEEEKKKKKSENRLSESKVEAILVSKKLGIHRMTEEQIQDLMVQEEAAA